MNKGMEEIQKKLQAELDKFKQAQKEQSKVLNTRQQLDAQLNENTMVKKELDLLKDDNEVYKLTGPVLLKMDRVEAKVNVEKRIEYIKKELQHIDMVLMELEKKHEGHRENLQKYQQMFQQAQLKAAIRS